jgi:hypothetical protein
MPGTTGRTNFSTMERGADVEFFGSYDTMKERPYIKSKAAIREQFDITPVNATNAYGQDTTFELDKRADRLGKIELIIDRGATVGAVGRAFNDWEGFAAIESFEVYYSNKLLHSAYGEELYHMMDREDDINPRAAQAAMQHGDKSLAQRQALALISARTVTRLRVPWEQIKRRLAMVALPNKIRFVVRLKALALAGNGITSVASGPSLTLRCQYYHLKQADRRALWAMSSSSEDGITTKYAHNEYHRREAIASGTSQFVLKVRNIKNAVFDLWGVVRLQSQVNTPGSIDLWTVIAPTSFYLRDNGSAVTEEIFVKDQAGQGSYGKYVQNFETHPESAQLGQNYFTIAFCDNELVVASDTDCFGSRLFNKYNNLELVLNFDPADLPSAAYLDLYGRIHNLMITKQGDLRRFLQ